MQEAYVDIDVEAAIKGALAGSLDKPNVDKPPWHARNEQDNESDIDIMILVNGSEDELRKNRPFVADISAELSMKHEN